MQKRSKRNLIIILSILGGLYLIYRFGRAMAPGSYPYAETYELNYSESLVKEAITKFKIENPQYSVPKITIDNRGAFDLLDGQTKNPSYWYVIYFYYPDKKEILYTWTRPEGRNKTTFAFVRINQGLDIGNWQDVNVDFAYTENKRIKKEFETRILEKIKSNLEFP